MLYINNDSLDPYHNLALEEYILKNKDSGEGCLMLWRNRPAVIVGRFQNTVEEVNTEYIKKNNIAVVRRLSGGGAVYHDPGNINFTFIEKREDKSAGFDRYTTRVARALAQMGVRAEISGRNDITIDGMKFSGNAQYHYRDKVLHHGTILYSADLTDIGQILQVKADKIESKGIKSVKSRVTNIQKYIYPPLAVEEFMARFKELLWEGENVREYSFSEDDKAAVSRLVKDKYLTWEWNYGHSPAFNLKRYGRFRCGGIEIRLSVEQGFIRTCKIYGDFFSSSGKDLAEFENKLSGVKYEEHTLDSLIEYDELEQYFGPLKKEELMELLFG